MLLNKEQFLRMPEPPHPLLKALYLEAKGAWNQAHQLVTDAGTEEAAWIHAYLHRVEGDQWNAGYWYRRADRPFSQKTPEQEWLELFNYFIGKYWDGTG